MVPLRSAKGRLSRPEIENNERSLVIHGHVPAKKNNWRPRRGGGIYLDKSLATAIDDLILSVSLEWIKLWHPLAAPKLEHPEMSVTFYVKNRGSDRDNKLSTILDILQKAGVITNDNIAHFNGIVRILPAIVSKNKNEEKTVITIS